MVQRNTEQASSAEKSLESESASLAWKVGDWAVFERGIVQIKEIREGGGCEVSDGSFSTFGRLMDRLRPLTLRNKRTVEWFAYYYRELNKISGERGFNYPDISRYFSNQALRAMDGDEKDRAPFDEVLKFIRQAREHTSIIHGVSLFRAA